MWLLNTSELVIEEFHGTRVPPYAALSHIWENDQDYISLQDIQNLQASQNKDPAWFSKPGFSKIFHSRNLANRDGLEWIWIDTCCVDRSSSAELAESINSMYKWCENATVCYVYLVDLEYPSKDGTLLEDALPACRWFTRSWTLQELVAPPRVRFFARDWAEIGTRISLQNIIATITGIPSDVLNGSKSPKEYSVRDRMKWASHRQATRVEDEAYSLLGLFDVQMPVMYGEGSRAFRRLQEEIQKIHSSAVLGALGTGGMRLLVASSDPLEIKNVSAGDIPAYAILSHTWGQDECSFQDLATGKAERRRGYLKVRKCCEQAAADGFDHVWVDTCCIDKTSSAELQEAICSMYKWYKNAKICYVYLQDYAEQPASSTVSNLMACRWFRRGWTLQELIAPTYVEFYDEKWHEIGTKTSLCKDIALITGIDPLVLRGAEPRNWTVAERMSWAASRSTSRVEDQAYSLMGLFDVFMPMLYGEGNRAFIRLQEEIIRHSEDYTIFAWRSDFSNGDHRGIFAESPAEFLRPHGSPGFATLVELETPAVLTSRGLHIHLPLATTTSKRKTYLAWVCSTEPSGDGNNSEEEEAVCIRLREIRSNPRIFVRISPTELVFLSASDLGGYQFQKDNIYILPSRSMTGGGLQNLTAPLPTTWARW